MQLSSPIFVNDDYIPEAYGPKGKNIHPPLVIENVPSNTTSLAIIMHDPNAIRRDFLHWAIWNIPATITTLDEGSIPSGAVEGMNDMKKLGYLRPMPPANTGVHHYVFELYALDILVELSPDADRLAIETVLDKHTIAKAKLVGLYER